MVTLLDFDGVQYRCTCGSWKCLCNEYFCRHCLTLRCSNCVSHEVDSTHCTNCLETIPWAEARMKKNKCGNCCDCPSCGHTLSRRATSTLGQGGGAEVATETEASRKLYYLVCFFCRWSSRDANIPDQAIATGNWPEPVCQHEEDIGKIIEQFRSIAAVEKAERERKRYTTKRRVNIGWTDKYGISNILTRKRLGLPIPGVGDTKDDGVKDIVLPCTDEVELLSDSIFVDQLKLDDITSIYQRHQFPEIQPVITSGLLPIRKQLSVKRSQRCKECDHNLCKAEFNPASIKFKIQLNAIYHVPEIRLSKCGQLKPDHTCEVVLSLSNLSASLTHVVLLPDMSDSSNLIVADFPTAELVLPARDESSEFDETDKQQYKDDPTVVVFRRGHKVGFRLQIRVPAERPCGAALWLPLIMKYDYVNTLLHLTGEKEEPEIRWLQQRVKVQLRL